MNVKVPQMGESITEATITKWLKAEGDHVERDEPLYEISTDKVDTEVPSPAAGVLSEIKVQEGEQAGVGEVVAVIGEEDREMGTPRTQRSQREDEREESTEEGSAGGEEERGDGEGAEEEARPGERGKPPKRNLQPARAEAERKTHVRRPEPKAVTMQLASRREEDVEIRPMSPMREKIAEHMVRSRRTSAHVTTVFEADMSRIVALRERSKEAFEDAHGLKLSYLPFVARAAIRAIHAYPVINSSVDGKNILLKRKVHLGIAVALPDGLIVPVIRRAEEKSFLGLTRAIHDLAERARSRKLLVDEVQGGTFTITNYGVFGGLFATPIINQPQVAILGVGTIQDRPVAVDGAVAVRPMVYLALSYDHRVIDGATAERYLGQLKADLEGWTEPIA